MHRLTDEDLEHSARELRQLAGVDDRFCPDVIYVANQLKTLGLISDFTQVPTARMAKDEAVYEGETRTLFVKERVFHALDAPGNSSVVDRRRARFTLAHEFGHIIQPAIGLRFRGASGQLAERLVASIRLDEVEANRFGAAFLVPDHLAEASLPAEYLSELFDVNLPVVRIRKEQLQRLNRRATGEPRPLPQGIVDLLSDAKKKGFSVPSLEIELERRRKEAIKNGFEGVACAACSEFRLMRSGGMLRCAACNTDQ